MLKKELQVTKLQAEIKETVEEKLKGEQRKFLLREQLKSIKQELGIEKDDKQAVITKFTERIAEIEQRAEECRRERRGPGGEDGLGEEDSRSWKAIPTEARNVIDSEMSKLSSLEKDSSEFNTTRNYLDWLTQIPWHIYSHENFDVERARDILNAEHYGLSDIKERILEFIAIGALTGSVQGEK